MASMIETVDSRYLVFAGGAFLVLYNRMVASSSFKASKQKQGGYGKLQIHKESTISQLFHPSEILAMFQMKRIKGSKTDKLSEDLQQIASPSIPFCSEKLNQVSRSFALVITFLPNSDESPLRLAVALFYLVLRALDTVEDEMDLSKFEPFRLEEDERASQRESLQATKERLLLTFHQRFSLDSKLQQLSGIGEAHELELLNNFSEVLQVFRLLPSNMQAVISEITQEMGQGMSDYIARDLRNGTKDAKDFSLYCHYVAGIVGKGLTRLFALHDTSCAPLVKRYDLWNSMGELLQRTNIIRDYLEDLIDGRAYWPESVGKLYTPQGVEYSLGYFATRPALDEGSSVACLNHMVADALELLPAVISYIDGLQNAAIFSFAALPQVMAIATLSKCFNNSKVFTGVVKLRKGTSAKIVVDFDPTSRGIEGLKESWSKTVLLYVREIKAIAKTIPNDVNAARVLTISTEIESLFKETAP